MAKKCTLAVQGLLAMTHHHCGGANRVYRPRDAGRATNDEVKVRSPSGAPFFRQCGIKLGAIAERRFCNGWRAELSPLPGAEVPNATHQRRACNPFCGLNTCISAYGLGVSFQEVVHSL